MLTVEIQLTRGCMALQQTFAGSTQLYQEVLLSPTPWTSPGSLTFGNIGLLPWKRILKGAWTICTAQEYMMTDLHELSATFFGVLKSAGAEFDPDSADVQEPTREDSHHCPCGRSFTTAQGLALHRVKAHRQFAPEHNFICGASCPHCLRFFWTSSRLQQHLAYIPRRGGGNACYQALLARGLHDGLPCREGTSVLTGHGATGLAANFGSLWSICPGWTVGDCGG